MGRWGITTRFLTVPGLEDMGIRILLNECESLSRGGESIYLAGIDDAHFYRVDKYRKGAFQRPARCLSILLSHTPEVYRHAAHAGFDLLLRAYTWRSNLSAWFYSNHVVLGAAQTFRIGGLEVP